MQYINEKYDIIIHDELNPRIWDEQSNLLPHIKEGILNITEEFKNYIDFDLPIVDIVLVGSNVSYNYTPNSDLDLHFIVNFDNIDENKELVNALCQGWKSLFNNAYDIKLGGQPVEVYVEDMKTSTNSNGIYSVLQDRWLKYPEKIEVPDFDIDPYLDEVRIEIETVLNSDNYDEVCRMIDWLYYQRKLALQIGGEFSVGNLIFKAIRNEGLLDDLKKEKSRLRSEQLTVEGLNEWWKRQNLNSHADKHRQEYVNDGRFKHTDDKRLFRKEYADISTDFQDNIDLAQVGKSNDETSRYIGFIGLPNSGSRYPNDVRIYKYDTVTKDLVIYNNDDKETKTMFKVERHGVGTEGQLTYDEIRNMYYICEFDGSDIYSKPQSDKN